MNDTFEQVLQEADALLKRITLKKDAALIVESKKIAQKMHGAANNLCYDKVTEFSPYIEKFYRKALELMEAVCEENDPDMEKFKKDVEYYNAT